MVTFSRYLSEQIKNLCSIFTNFHCHLGIYSSQYYMLFKFDIGASFFLFQKHSDQNKKDKEMSAGILKTDHEKCVPFF